MARPKSTVRVSRDRVFAAAAHEFATRGYAGANVDRIARAARLNKAMIYYHFKSKAALYRAILRDMFDAVRTRVAAAAASEAAPEEKIRAYIAAIPLSPSSPMIFGNTCKQFMRSPHAQTRVRETQAGHVAAQQWRGGARGTANRCRRPWHAARRRSESRPLTAR